MYSAVLLLLVASSVNSLPSGGQIKTGARDVVACSPDTQPRVLTDPSGSFTSENFPADYVNDAICKWLIVAQPGQIVNLDFASFDTERGYDRVWIYDGDNEQAAVIQGLDGSRSPPPINIHSSQENMFVVFSTDTANTASGFSAQYSSIEPTGVESACSTVFRPLLLSSSSATFTSPYFPSPYPFGSVCEWLITASEPGAVVRLDFGSFLTEANADYVTIYDGDTDSSPFIARLSGFYQPPPSGFLTTQQRMFVRFTSDLAVSVRGFNATFTTVPAL